MSYIVHSEEDRRYLLGAVGVEDLQDLFSSVPAALRRAGLDLAPGMSEAETRAYLEDLAGMDRPLRATSFLGAGCYRHFVPAAVRALVSRGEFATAYTPYQPEVSQGTLQGIFEFQSCICELTGLEVANASLYDGPSALAEAAFMGLRLTRRETIAVSAGLHPEAARVVETFAAGPAFPVRRSPLDPDTGATDLHRLAVSPEVGVVLVQQPNVLGVIEDLEPLADAAHSAGALLVVSVNPSTLGILEAPGRLGADIVTGDAQVFGNAPSFGGPSVGFLACAAAHVRQIPGRLVGRTTDADGRTCYTLTLQAREQHIRRAKATSNICSNQALSALAATIHLSLLGPQGLRELGEVCLRRAHYLHEALCALPGVRPLVTGPFFSEFALALPFSAHSFTQAMRARGVDPGVPLTRIEQGARAVFEAPHPDEAAADEGAAGPDNDGRATAGAKAGGRVPLGARAGGGAAAPEAAILVAVTEVNTPEAIETYIAAARKVLGEPGTPGPEVDP